MSLDFGLLYDVIVPRPWGPTTELDRFQAVIDQMVTADRNNFTNVWMVEHHYLPEFSHSSAPDAVLGAVAALTENVKIGFGVKLMPFNYNHPVRNAEKVATMDLVSNGRVVAGTGRSFSREELEGYGCDPRRTRAEWEEGTRMMVEAWTKETFSWDSEAYKIPERVVVPKPVQKPHPPLWLACNSEDSHVLAAHHGLGCLSFTVIVPLEILAGRTEAYRKNFTDTNLLGEFANFNIGTYTVTHCAETDELAREQAAVGIEKFLRTGLEIAARTAAWIEGIDVPDMAYMQQMADVDLDILTFDLMDATDMCIVGSPERCIEKAKRFAATGITQLIMSHDVWGMPEDQKKKSIELFGKYVIPEFRDVTVAR